MGAYPISNELRAIGCTFLDSYKNKQLSAANGATFVGDPDVDNGVSLDGSTQSFYYEKNEIHYTPKLGVGIEFTAEEAFDDSSTSYIFDTTPNNDFTLLKHSSNILSFYINGVNIFGSALFEAYWRLNEKNILWISSTSGDTSAWLNGHKVIDADASTFTAFDITRFTIGARFDGASKLEGIIHKFMFFNNTLTDEDADALSKGFLLGSRSAPSYSVLSLPMNEVKVNGSGASYTPIEGTTTETEALLGSDGLTPSEMPTLLDGGGFSFDGADFITVADADEFTFSDGSGDLPFSICFQYKPGNVSVQAGLIGKSINEFLLYQNGATSKLTLQQLDSTLGGYFSRVVDSVLLVNVTETWVWTSSGSGAGGIKIYRNGILAASTSSTVAPYTQLRNTANVLEIGRYATNYLPNGSELHKPKIVNYEMSATEALLWHESVTQKYSGSIISEITEKKSVITLPLTEVLVNSGGETYTPIYGSSTNKEALMGSDGLTASEMPILLPRGGMSFDGGDFITIPDSDEYTFSDDNGDLPFSVCMYFKPSDKTILCGIIGKYSTPSDGEWVIYQPNNSKIRFFFADQSTGGYFSQEITELLIDNLVETIIFTYDGSGSGAGIEAYRNGLIAPTNASAGSGSYTQMRNSTRPLEIGRYSTNFLPSGSEVLIAEIKPYEMSSAQARAWDRKAKALNRGR